MATRAIVTAHKPYDFKTPEQRANEAVRYQKRLASTMQRGEERVSRISALQALAKGVPENVLPAGGIHPNMSPADVQNATDKINRWRAENGQKTGTPQAPDANTQYVNGVPVPKESIPVPTGHTVSGTASPGPGATRTTPTGGMETLVQSQSGPRWVASVANPPPVTNNGLPPRDPAATAAAASPAPFVPSTGPLNVPHGTGNDAADIAANRRMYTPGGVASVLPPRAGPPPQQVGLPAVITSEREALAIGSEYAPKDSPYGSGVVTRGRGTYQGYAGEGTGAPPTRPSPIPGLPPVTGLAASGTMPPKPTLISQEPISKPVVPSTVLPVSSPSRGPLMATAPDTQPTASATIPGIPAKTTPDDEEERKRLAAQNSRQPYQF